MRYYCYYYYEINVVDVYQFVSELSTDAKEFISCYTRPYTYVIWFILSVHYDRALYVVECFCSGDIQLFMVSNGPIE